MLNQVDYQRVTQPLSKGLSRQAKVWFWCSQLALATFALSGCGSSGDSASDLSGSSTVESSARGNLTVAITDAEGDFVTYTVDVLSIELEKLNGAIVETVPINTRIDFAEYTELSEIFTTQSIPEGTYTKVTLTLDYRNANIMVQDEEGVSHQATAVNELGAPLTTYALALQMPEDGTLKIRAGMPANLTIDFDLDSSNTILSYEPAVVEVEPYLLATATLDENREHRARGELGSVNAEAGSFELTLKPFTEQEGEFGSVTVNTDDATQFEINGESYTGSEGIAALADQAADTPVLVWGEVEAAGDYLAQTVVAGSSVPWVGRDSIRGVVIAREGNLLTVRGSHASSANSSAIFYDDMSVTLGTDTQVTAPTRQDEALSLASVSIGQRVVVFGEVTGSTSGNISVDATQGHVRMMMNLLKGEVVSVQPLVVDLRWVNGRRLGIFDFDGTGVSDEQDAEATAYEVDTGTLSLSQVDVGEWVKLRGFPTNYGAAPMDFTASTVIDINEEQRAGLINVIWNQAGSAAPFLTTSSESIVLDLTDARFQNKQAGVPVDGENEQPASATLQPLADQSRGVFGIKVSGEPAVQLFSDFASYSTALNAQLNEGGLLKRLVSIGRYDQTTTTMNAGVITARFRNE